MVSKKTFYLAGLFLVFFHLPKAWAQTEPTLPYSTRSREFAGWRNTVQGDIRMVGMSGAVAGLTDGFVSSTESPSGLAMSQRGFALQLVTNGINDGQLQDQNQAPRWVDFGLATGIYPWGISVGRWTPAYENQIFSLSTLGGTRARLINRVDEYRFSIARVFLKNRFSIGATLIYGSANRSITSIDSNSRAESFTSHDLGLALGTSFQLPYRLVVGMTYQAPMSYAGNPNQPSVFVPGFFQRTRSPWRVSWGVGWWLSRICRLGAGVSVAGPTKLAGLLSDEVKQVGGGVTIQPRIGGSYTFIEKRNFKAYLSLGTYLEDSRIQSEPIRFHGTAGLDFDIWAFNLGWGIDLARRYENYIYVAGIDVLRTLRFLKFAPPERTPRYRGYFPSPAEHFDEGLARPLIAKWEPSMENPTILDIGKEIPDRIQKRFEEFRSIIETLPKTAPQNPSSPKEKKDSSNPKP